MKKIAFTIGFIAINLISFSQIIDTIPNPAFWYKADNFNDSTLILHDCSGNGNDLTLNQAFQLGDTLINFQDCLISDTIQSSINIDYRPKEDCELSVFSVYKPKKSNEAIGIWSLKLDSINRISISTQDIVDLSAEKTIYADSTESLAVINLLQQKWKYLYVDSTITTPLNVFGTDSVPFEGSFAEFILYDTIISSTDMAKAYTYLAIKYGICINKRNYMNSAGDTIWNYEENQNFTKEVAGIGMDTCLNINKKQSCALGGESEMTIFTGDLRTKNSDNTSVINQYDFLIWSNNGMSLSFNQSDTISNDLLKGISQKKWLMSRSGITATDVNTNIKIAPPSLPDSTLMLLVINREADFDFPVETTEVHVPIDLDSLGNFYFENIFWDIDRSGKDAFAFQYFDLKKYLEDNNYSNSENNDESNNLFNDINDFVANNPEVTENTNNNYEQNQISENNFVEGVQHFSVYPNPSNGDYSIEVNLENEQNASIKILDKNSRIVESFDLNGSNNFEIRKSLSVIGCYLVVLETANGSKTIKLVIK